MRGRQALGRLRRRRSRTGYTPKAPQVFVHFVYRDLAECTIPMGDVVYRPFNLDPTERFCVAALAQTRGARRIFEFGTYDGATTLLLARSAPEADIVTLDLPADKVGELDEVSEQQLAVAGGVGSKFRDQPEASRITQLLVDSRTFDPGPYAGQMDLVLVDGGHGYDIVRTDSEHALEMLAPGGIVVWDDYGPEWPEVAQAADDIAAERGIALRRLWPTGFAVYDASAPA